MTHQDNYVCLGEAYRNHMAKIFMAWHEHPEVVAGHWPKTLEECFSIEPKYAYPPNRADAEALADYFIDVYAPAALPTTSCASLRASSTTARSI